MIEARMIGHQLASSLRDGHDFARWTLKLFGALARMTPGSVAASALSFLLSQTLLLAALILPWKLLLFLSSGHSPVILPHFLASYTSRELVVTFGTAALFAFLVHFLFDVAFGVLARRGAHHVLKRHRKIGLFNNQQRVAVSFYRHILRVVASVATCGLVMLALALIYPLMLFALIVCFLIGLLGIAIWRRIPLDPERRSTPGALGKLWMGGGFLFLTGWIVADYWRGHLPHLTVAFISLLLARQALTFAAHIVQSLQSLGRQRSRVEALFLADMPWVPGSRAMDDFQALLAPGRREDWIRDVLAHCCERDILISDVQLRLAEGGKLAYLKVTAGGNVEAAFLIKLFHRSLDALVQHEMEILSVATLDWPTPFFVGYHRIQRHHCLVFGWDCDGQWLDRPQRTVQLSHLRSRLLDCSLPIELVDRYDRSQPHLARRLWSVDWGSLRALATSEEMLGCCASVEAHWTVLLEQADALPRHLVLPGLVGRMMASRRDDLLPVICNWSRWRWEPVGAGWPITPEGRKELQSIFDDYEGPRDELARVDSEIAYRAALLHEMERCLSKSNLSAALIAVERLYGSIVHYDILSEMTVATVRQSNAWTMRDERAQLSC